MRTVLTRTRRRQSERSPVPGPGKDEGFTLSELIVAMFVIAIVLAVAGTMVASTTSNYRLAAGKAGTQADSRLIIEAVTRDLRVAVPVPVAAQSDRTFTTATGTEMVFYTSRQATAARPNKIQYTVDPASGNCLRRTVVKPVVAGNGTLSYPGTGANVESYCLASSQVATAQPIFTYFTVNPAGAVSPTTNPAAIASVQIRTSLTSPAHPEVNPTVATQTVTLINQSNQIQSRSLTP